MRKIALALTAALALLGSSLVLAAPRTTNGDDTIRGTAGKDKICGKLGDDVINARGGNDIVFGDACQVPGKKPPTVGGDDVLNGGPGKDELYGGPGKDEIDGGGASNNLQGGKGNDTISARNRRRDTVNCGKGRGDAATVDNVDLLTGCEKVTRPRKR